MKHKLLFLLLLIFLWSCNSSEKTEYTLIKGGTIIDMSDNGMSSNDISNGFILFSNNEIIKTGIYTDELVLPKNTRVIDAEGKFIVPGLIDGFAVQNNQFYANAYLYSGVTTIIGVDGGRRGWFYPDAKPGPDFYMLESVGDEVKPDSAHLKDLRELHKEAYKIALLKYKLTPNQVKLLHNEAKKLGMGTIGELGYTSYAEGIKTGIDAFVHTTRYSLDVAPKKMRDAVANQPFSDDLNSPKWKYYQFLSQLDTSDKALIQHAMNLVSGNTYLMPTISLLYGDIPGHKNLWKEKVAAILNPNDINNPLNNKTGNHDYTKEQQDNYTSMALQELKIEYVYQNTGAKYLAGSGTDVWGTMPGISLHTELELLHRIGLDNRQTMAAASSNFSDAFGWKTGRIEPGYEVDILILDENPLSDLQNLKKIHVLINNGRVIDYDNLLKLTYDKEIPDGKIIYKSEFNPFTDTAAYKLVYSSSGRNKMNKDFQFLDDINMEELYYMSDGYRVKAMLASPKKKGKYPVIIYNRGGNREFSKVYPKRVVDILARIAQWGYVVIASQYRGVDGGDGQEEFGGDDVNDVLNLIPLLEHLPQADQDKIGMYGKSRGGMMTYLALMQTNKIKAAVVMGGVTDLSLANDNRNGEMEQYVYSQLIPDYWQNRDSLLWLRSAIHHVDKLPKSTPFLLLHGTSDWRVSPDETFNMAKAFQENSIPYRLVMFEGGDHGITEYKTEVNQMIRNWFDRYLKNDEKLPSLIPHGK